MTGRVFSVWEGATWPWRSITMRNTYSSGERELAAGKAAAALADFQAAGNIPDNLPSDAGAAGGREAQLAYWTGLAQEALGDAGKARQCWRWAASASKEGRGRGSSGGRFNPNRSAERYYAALAQRKLGQTEQADAALKSLLEAAKADLDRETTTSQPTQRERRGRNAGPASSHYLAGLAYLGLGENEAAKEQLAATSPPVRISWEPKPPWTGYA